MSKTSQILEINPPTELHFQGPFTQVVSSELTLNNPSDKHVCFKIKTTAPKRYCVKPNIAILQARQRVAVRVMLQPFDFDPNEKNKHKFMVQSILVASPTADIETVWKNACHSDLMVTKLECVFDWTVASAFVQISEEIIMATAEASPVEWKTMKQPFHNCSICLEDYVKPKMLPCGHTFCQSCLEKLPLLRRGKTTFQCPECKKTVKLPTSRSMGDLPTNFAILGVIESTQVKNLCPKHKKCQDLFCVTCDECICAECFEESHKSGGSPVAHVVTSTKTPANKTLKRLQSLAEELQNSQHRELLNRISILEKQQAQDFGHIIEKINYQKEQMILQIERQAEDLIKALEIDAKEKRENMDDVTAKLERAHAEQTRRAKACLSLAEEISNYGLSQFRYERSESLFTSERKASITDKNL